jgi:CMP-N-acetylneuraminic acid synthetase
VVVMLQPTSPLRLARHVEDTIRKLVDENLDSVWTVSETDSKAHPLKQLTVENGRLGYYDSRGKAIIARQQLVPVYHRNGLAYAITRECLLEQGTIMGEKAGALVVAGDYVSIDTEWDIDLVEFLWARRDGAAPEAESGR